MRQAGDDEKAFNVGLGQAVREAREMGDEGLTQRHLSYRTGQSQASANHWETGKNGLTAYRLYQVASVLKVSPAALVQRAVQIAARDRAKRKRKAAAAVRRSNGHR